jgi:hypothetical protein
MRGEGAAAATPARGATTGGAAAAPAAGQPPRGWAWMWMMVRGAICCAIQEPSRTPTTARITPLIQWKRRWRRRRGRWSRSSIEGGGGEGEGEDSKFSNQQERKAGGAPVLGLYTAGVHAPCLRSCAVATEPRHGSCIYMLHAWAAQGPGRYERRKSKSKDQSPIAPAAGGPGGGQPPQMPSPNRSAATESLPPGTRGQRGEGEGGGGCSAREVRVRAAPAPDRPAPAPHRLSAIGLDQLRDQRGQRRRYWPPFAPWVR